MTNKTTLFLILTIAVVGCQQAETETPAPAPSTEIVAEAPADAPALLPKQKAPMDGIITGGQPSPNDLAALRDAGYKTVLNMRKLDEQGVGNEAEVVEGLGMSYISLPIAGAPGLTKENVEAFAAALEGAEYPLAVHCGSGNRVGAMFALKAFWLDGKNSDEALQIGLDSGMTRLEGAVREILSAESAS